MANHLGRPGMAVWCVFDMLFVLCCMWVKGVFDPSIACGSGVVFDPSMWVKGVFDPSIACGSRECLIPA